MLDTLRIALKTQKKLIFIFLVTIFLPSLALAVLGIRAIRVERHRIARNVELEHRRAADYLKSQLQTRLEQVETSVREAILSPSFRNREYSVIAEALTGQFAHSPMIDHIFVCYQGKTPWFPLLELPPLNSGPSPEQVLDDSMTTVLKRAEEYEFRQKTPGKAIPLYEELLSSVGDNNTKAQMLNNIARCLMSLKLYPQAVDYYSRIGKEHPASMSSSGMPLGFVAKMQIAECYRRIGDDHQSLEQLLGLYDGMVANPILSGTSRFATYSALIEASIEELLAEEDHQEEFRELKSLHKETLERLETVSRIREDILPDVRQTLLPWKQERPVPFRLAASTEDTDLLISFLPVSETVGEEAHGFLGVTFNSFYLERDVVREILEQLQFSEQPRIRISDSSGRLIQGNGDMS